MSGIYTKDVKILERLNQVGFERARRATAALALSLFVFLYLVLALNPPLPGWTPAFGALALCYGVAFMGVAAEWFWGRWFAIGLGWSGVMMAVASMVMIGWNPALAIYGGLHGAITLALAGKKMADRYDLQAPWRERYGMDEFGVARLRKTVTRASASLPSMILWALGPKESGEGMVIAGLAATALAVAGLSGVVRLRTWGLAALASAAALFGLTAMDAVHPSLGTALSRSYGAESAFAFVHSWLPAGLAVLLLAAVIPFIRPALRYIRR